MNHNVFSSARDEEQNIGELDVESPSAAPGAAKNAMADLLDLDFGSSSEPAYSSPPVSSSQKQSSSGPNYSADLFDMSSDMGSGGGAFGGMGGMGGLSAQEMAMMQQMYGQ